MTLSAKEKKQGREIHMSTREWLSFKSGSQEWPHTGKITVKQRPERRGI